MANKKISQLTPGTTLVGTELIPIVQGGVTVSTTPNEIGDLIKPYKVYTALLTQSGVTAPVATILENTLDNPVTYSRYSSTFYGIICSDFIVGSTIVFASSTGEYSGKITLDFQTSGQMYLFTEPAGPSGGEGIIKNTSIEIKIYS